MCDFEAKAEEWLSALPGEKPNLSGLSDEEFRGVLGKIRSITVRLKRSKRYEPHDCHIPAFRHRDDVCRYEEIRQADMCEFEFELEYRLGYISEEDRNETYDR